jgi:hypothetical protein
VSALILDSEAVSRLARQTANRGRAHAALTAALAAHWPVRVPAAVLAEQYRGGRFDQPVDAFLSKHTEAIEIQDTDRLLARTVGNLLSKHNRGSEDHVDATVVATAIRCGGAIILTCDQGAVETLAEGLPGITVEVLR